MKIWESINGRSWQIIAESAVISRKLAQALLLYILVVISELCVHGGVVPIFGNSVYKYCCARLSANWTCYVTSRHAIKPMHFRRKKSWRDMSRLSDSMVRHARHDERDTSPHDTHDVCVVSTVSLRKAQIPLVASRHDTHDVTWRDVTWRDATSGIWALRMHFGCGRYVATALPLRYRVLATNTSRCYAIVAGLWTAALVTFIAPLLTRPKLISYRYSSDQKMCIVHWEHPLYTTHIASRKWKNWPEVRRKTFSKTHGQTGTTEKNSLPKVDQTDRAVYTGSIRHTACSSVSTFRRCLERSSSSLDYASGRLRYDDALTYRSHFKPVRAAVSGRQPDRRTRPPTTRRRSRFWRSPSSLTSCSGVRTWWCLWRRVSSARSRRRRPSSSPWRGWQTSTAQSTCSFTRPPTRSTGVTARCWRRDFCGLTRSSDVCTWICLQNFCLSDALQWHWTLFVRRHFSKIDNEYFVTFYRVLRQTQCIFRRVRTCVYSICKTDMGQRERAHASFG